jgi:hypothetical protein
MCCKEILQAFGASRDCLSESALQAEEDGKRFKIELSANSKETFCRVHVDHSRKHYGLIQNNRKRCDYWMRRCQNLENYFIEFKGSDIQDGFEQIIETITQVREKGIPLSKNLILGFVVSNKVPLAATDVQNLKEKFKASHGKDFIVKSKEYVHRIE